jgi:hypothetical protein
MTKKVWMTALLLTACMTFIAQGASTAGAAAASSGQAAALIVVSLSTAKAHYQTGEQISLTVKITNVSGGDLLLAVGKIKLHTHPLRLDITDSMGSPVRKHRVMKTVAMAS